jgi:hypothetical protein
MAGSGFPAIRDTGGYLLQPRDAAFVNVSLANLQAMAQRQYALGLSSPADWTACCVDMRNALQNDGLHDADVRLKGSSTEFFSRNPSKVFPRNGADCHAQAAVNGLDGPTAEAHWIASPYASTSTLPNQCFWDCRHQLGIDSERSDYDFQISSDILVNTILAAYPPTTRRGRSAISNHGGHYKDAILRRTFSALAAWSAHWQTQLNRKVNLAGYPRAGPSNLISRFDAKDWVIIP